MGKQVWMEVTDLAREKLAAIGFQTPGRGLYVIDISPQTQGRLILGRADQRGRLPDVSVHPGIGVMNRAIQMMLDEIMGEKWRPYGWKPLDNLTFIRSLGHLTGRKQLTGWRFRAGYDHEALTSELVEAVKTYGLPFMRAHDSLATLAEALADLRQGTLWHRGYAAPVAYYLLGGTARARGLVEQEMRRILECERKDPTAPPDMDYRHFAAELERRMNARPEASR